LAPDVGYPGEAGLRERAGEIPGEIETVLYPAGCGRIARRRLSRILARIRTLAVALEALSRLVAGRAAERRFLLRLGR
jgi:hypothetical protein